MSGKSPSLLDDTFEILTIDPDGKKFDKGQQGAPPPSPPPPPPSVTHPDVPVLMLVCALQYRESWATATSSAWTWCLTSTVTSTQ